MTKDDLEKRKATELWFLREIFDESKGVENYFVAWEPLQTRRGVDPMEGKAILQFLLGEGLLIMRGGQQVGITHTGVVEMRRVIEGAETEHFSRAVINIFQNISNSNVQVSSPGGDADRAIAGARPLHLCRATQAHR